MNGSNLIMSQCRYCDKYAKAKCKNHTCSDCHAAIKMIAKANKANRKLTSRISLPDIDERTARLAALAERGEPLFGDC